MAALFTICQDMKGKINVHQEMNGLRTCGVYTQWEDGGHKRDTNYYV